MVQILVENQGWIGKKINKIKSIIKLFVYLFEKADSIII